MKKAGLLTVVPLSVLGVTPVAERRTVEPVRGRHDRRHAAGQPRSNASLRNT